MKKKVLIFNPTPNEFAAVTRHVGAASFNNLEVKNYFTGPGKVNAACGALNEVMKLRREGREPDFILGVGTAGSLSRALKSGDVIVSREAVVSDWQMLDGADVQHAPYGELAYAPMTSDHLAKMKMRCDDKIVRDFTDALDDDDFKRGAMLSSDTFVAGLDLKLAYGEKFQCVACDMESAVFAYVAEKKLGGIPWFNVRVVADTLDDSFHHYVKMEMDMVDILGHKLIKLLKGLDERA